MLKNYIAVLILLSIPSYAAAQQAGPAPAVSSAAAAGENRVDELEKQLRATQEYMFTEFGKLAKPEETGPKKSGKKRSGLFPVNNAVADNQLRVLIRAKYDYTEEGTDSSGKRVAPVSGYSLSHARLWYEGAVDEHIGYRIKLEFASKGNNVQLQEAYGTWSPFPDKLVVAVGQRQPKTTGDPSAELWPFVSPLNSSDTLKWSGTDRGLGVSGRFLARRFFYEAQMMNGNGIGGSEPGNDNYGFLYSLLARFEPNGEMTPAQNDIGFSEFHQGFALAGARSEDKTVRVGSRSYTQQKTWYSGAYTLKWNGFFANALFAAQKVTKPAGGAKDQLMWAAMASYAMRAWAGHIVEPLARFEKVDYNLDAQETSETRATLGLNYYLAGEKARFAVNYTMKREKGVSSIDNDTVQAMYMIYF